MTNSYGWLVAFTALAWDLWQALKFQIIFIYTGLYLKYAQPRNFIPTTLQVCKLSNREITVQDYVFANKF